MTKRRSSAASELVLLAAIVGGLKVPCAFASDDPPSSLGPLSEACAGQQGEGTERGGSPGNPSTSVMETSSSTPSEFQESITVMGFSPEAELAMANARLVRVVQAEVKRYVEAHAGCLQFGGHKMCLGQFDVRPMFEVP